MGRKRKTSKLVINNDPYQFVSSHPSLSIPISPEALLQRLGESGLTNEQIAPFFGLSVFQFQELISQNPDLQNILDQAKTIPNQQVESSLFKRALGYSVKEIHKVEGKPAKVIIKEIAPDVIADIFWLKNRDPKRWRDTLEVSHTLRDRFDRAHQALRLGYSGPKEDEEESKELES